MVATSCRASALLAAIAARNSRSHACVEASRSAASSRSMIGSTRSSSAASSRSVGTRACGSRVSSPAGGLASDVHRARAASSSRAARHWSRSTRVQSCCAMASSDVATAVLPPAAPSSPASTTSRSSRRRASPGVVTPAAMARSSSRRSSRCCLVASPACDCVRTPSVSPSPSNTRRGTMGSSGKDRSPTRSVSRWAARLPLSTVDTYIGSSGCRVWVSYQL